MELNWAIRGEDKFRAFVDENATIDFAEALDDLKGQFLATEGLSAYTLTADKSKSGEEVSKKFMGIVMNYDAQGTQLGGGKAYLDGEKAIARKDITIAFM
jgi:hypothetical protein